MAKEKNSFRSQFKAQSIKSLRKTVDKDDAMVGVKSNDYLNLEDNKPVKIRIFPAHPEHENFYVARKCYWISWANDDGEMRRGTVLDSVTHGGTKMDIVQEYVKYAKKKYGDDAGKMNDLLGTGIDSHSLNPQYSWLCYADIVQDDQELRPRIWEFKKMVRDLLNKLAFSEDDDEPIEVDPFTDPDDGLVLQVKYLKKPNKKKGETYYDVDFAKKSKQPYARPLTDEELENFMTVKPLDEVIPRYGRKEFDRALEGLQNWDEEYGFGIFDDDEWLEIVEAVKAQYDSSNSEDDEDEKPAKKKTVKKETKKVVKPEPEDDDDDDSDEDVEETQDEDEDEETETTEDDEFTDMDRTELKKYIKSEGLDITVKKSMTDDDLRDAIREAVKAAADEDEDEETETESDSEDDDDEDDEKGSGKMSLADIRKKLAKK